MTFVSAVVSLISLCFIVQISQPYKVIQQLKYYKLSIETVFGLNAVTKHCSEFQKFVKFMKFTKYFCSDQIKEDKTSRASGTCTKF